MFIAVEWSVLSSHVCEFSVVSVAGSCWIACGVASCGLLWLSRASGCSCGVELESLAASSSICCSSMFSRLCVVIASGVVVLLPFVAGAFARGSGGSRDVVVVRSREVARRVERALGERDVRRLPVADRVLTICVWLGFACLLAYLPACPSACLPACLPA